MHPGILWQTIYWLPSPVLALVTGLLWRRKLRGKFPFFFSYIVVALLRDLACLVAYKTSDEAYLYTYWISHLIRTGFMLLAINELFINRLFPQFYKVTFYRHLFSVAALIVLTLGIFTALGGIKMSVLAAVIRTLDVLRVVILLFFVALMVFMGRQWGRYEFGITSGLIVDSATFLVTFAIFLKSGPLHGIVRELPVFGYDAACLIWLVTFTRPEKSKPGIEAPVSPGIVQEAKQWERTLRHSLTGEKSTK